MAKIKKISINAFENAVKANCPNTFIGQWNGLDIVITKTISLQDMAAIVAEVTENCFLTDGTYVPETMEAVLQRAVVSRYTNLNLPSNMSNCYDLIEQSGIIDFLLEHINRDQYNEICHAVDRKVEYICDAKISEIEANIKKLFGAFDDLQEKTAQMFEHVSPTDLQKLVGAIGEDGALSADKVVKEYIEQTRVKDAGEE